METNLFNNRLGQTLAEINGKPGVVWGNVIVPASGRSKIKIKVVGDFIQTNIDLAYGLEKKEIVTSIIDVNAIEIAEGRLWWLLFLGITTLPWLIGIVFITLFFVLNQRWIIIYSSSINLILFFRSADNIEQFRRTVLTIKRQLNNPAFSKSNGTRGSIPNGLSSEVPQ